MAFHPSFSQPASDDELLAAVPGRTGFSAQELVTRFESLGDDCEFGFVQRKCGAEPLGLFRFSNPSAEVVLQALKTDFVEIGQNAAVELDSQQPRREWILVDREHGLRQHTHIFDGDQPEDVVLNRQLNRFRFLRRKINEDIASGDKVFVIKSAERVLPRDLIESIAEELRSKGPSWLLWVEAGTRVGHVEVLKEGLFRAEIDRLTKQPDGPHFSLAGWLAVLSETVRLLVPRHSISNGIKEES